MSSTKQQKLKQQPATNLLIQQQQLQINRLQDQLNQKGFQPRTKNPKQKFILKQIQPQKSLAKTVQQSQQQQSQQQQIDNTPVSSNTKVKNFVSKNNAPKILLENIALQREQTINIDKKTPFNRTSFVKNCYDIKSLLIGDSYTAHIMKDPHQDIITLSYTGMNLKYLPKSPEELNTILDNKKKKMTKLFYTVEEDQQLCYSYLIKTETKAQIKKDLFRHFIDNSNLRSIGLWLGNAHFQYVFYHDLISKSFLSEMIDEKIDMEPQLFLNTYKLFRDEFIEQAIENYSSYIQLISQVFQNKQIFIIKLNHSPVVDSKDMYITLYKEAIYNKEIKNIEQKLTYIFDLLTFKERKLIVKKFNFGLKKKLKGLNLINIHILSLDDIIYTEKREYIKKDFKHRLEGGEVNRTERHIIDNNKSDIWKRITENLLNIQIQYDLKRIIEFPINKKSRKSNNANSILIQQTQSSKSKPKSSKKSNNVNSVTKPKQKSSKKSNNVNSVTKSNYTSRRSSSSNIESDMWKRNTDLPPRRTLYPRQAKNKNKYGKMNNDSK